MKVKLLICRGLLLLAVSANTTVFSQTTIQLEKQGGVYMIPCKVNGLPLKFIFDTGASDVTLSITEALFMLKNGFITESDFTGKEKYRVANGEVEEGYTLVLRDIDIEGMHLTNVEASIIESSNAPLLLGQSALNKLGVFHFDYAKNTLTIGGAPSLSSGSSSLVESYTTPEGSMYIGEWRDGLANGNGTYTTHTGNKYVGEFKDGKFNGHGTLTGIGGMKYVGEFEDDDFNGKGSYTWANGGQVCWWMEGWKTQWPRHNHGY
jgi:clan AA aspartic protease (TIGR02281 family)